MLAVTEAEADAAAAAAAIQAVFNAEGELSTAIERRRRFPGITDNAKARERVRIIAGWMPLKTASRAVTPLRLGRKR